MYQCFIPRSEDKSNLVFLFAREEYLAKIERRIKEYKICVLNEPREGKKLLVLDIDYTLFGMYQLSLWKGTVNVQCT